MNHNKTFLLSLWACLNLFQATAEPQGITHHHNTYEADYVVVGVGTSGATVCKLLTEDRVTSVVALEAGDNCTADPAIELSKNYDLIDKSQYCWTGQTLPQEGLLGRAVEWSTGRLLGGGSAVNNGIYLRATNDYFSQWEQIADERWSAANILTLTKRLENFAGIPGYYNLSTHGMGGLISLRQAPTTPLATVNTIVQSLQAIVLNSTGILIPFTDDPYSPINIDYNDPAFPLSVSTRMQYFQKGPGGAYRVNSATEMLGNHVMTPNGYGIKSRKLRVLLKSLALEIIWDGHKAKGIKFLRQQKEHKALARKGVILCAGMHTSHLLQISGIGPKALLQQFNIPVKYDNPNVGTDVHAETALMIFLTPPNNFQRLDPNASVDWMAFLPDPDGDPKVRAVQIASRICNQSANIPSSMALTITPLKSKSKGKITLQSKDPLQPPLVDLGLLSNPVDLNFYMRILQEYGIPLLTELKNQGFVVINDPTPNLGEPIALEAFVRNHVNLCTPVNNFTGMAKMGRKDLGGVVDPYGRVYGVKKLFIADNSIAPFPIDGNGCTLGFQIGYNIGQGILKLKKK